jgi:hypothetical protein
MDGWAVSEPSKFSKEANDELELQVLQDFGKIEGRDYLK